MSLSNKRIILCRPQGGLNDKLTQIEACSRYAEKNQRIVIVDTNYKHSDTFRDSLSNYFISTQSSLVLDADEHEASFEAMSVVPNELKGIVNDYVPVWDMERALYKEEISGKPITFDFSKSYDEQLLVLHEPGGAPNIAQFCLLRMRLHDSLVNELSNRLKKIQKPYSAIHIRNTDMKTEYSAVIEGLKRADINKLFLATDDIRVIHDFKSSLGDKVISFSDIPNNNGSPIHTFTDSTNAYNNNKDAILDLLTLAFSSRLFLAKVKDKKYGEYSGYSLLANNLYLNRIILRHLISRNDIFWKGCFN